MIKTFADKETQQIFLSGKSKHLPPDLIRRATRRLEYIDLAKTLNDLKVPPSNRLHALKGDPRRTILDIHQRAVAHLFSFHRRRRLRR
jgi:plasmid maintenance system killer protein